MTRAIDRLIVSGAIDPEKASERTTPIGWVLERLDAHGELATAGRDPVELERGGARLLVRVDRYGQPSDKVSQGEERPVAEPAQLVALLRGGRAGAAASRRGCPSSCRFRCRRSSRCAGCRSPRSRRSSAARTATTRNGSSACARCGRWRPTATGSARSTSATPCTDCSRRSTCATRSSSTWSACARGIRASATRSCS